jgi:hypothetical protein
MAGRNNNDGIKKRNYPKVQKVANGGEGQPKWKPMSPLARAFMKAMKSKKEKQRLESSMSHVIHKEMMIGMSSCEDFNGHGQPHFFANNPKMTARNEEKKIHKNLKMMLPEDVTMPQYNLRSSIVPQEIQLNKNGVTVPKPDIQAQFKKVMCSDIDNRLSHRYLSLICTQADLRLRAMMSAYLGLTDIGENINLIHSIAAPLTPERIVPKGLFRHNSISYNCIETADYKIHTCITKHEFTSADDSSGLVICKKIVLASYKHSETNINIPICEELTIQRKEKKYSTDTNSHHLVNTDSFLVIALTAYNSENKQASTSLNFFGDNSFSIDLDKSYAGILDDKFKTGVRLAGKLCASLLEIHSNNAIKKEKSLKYFQDMFTELEKSDQAIFQVMVGDLKRKLSAKDESGSVQQNINELKDKLVALSDITVDMDNSPERKEIERQISSLEKKEADGYSKISEEEKIKIINSYIEMKSFIVRQNIRALLQVDKGRPCNSGFCQSSHTFSIVTLSPQLGKNYVFILTTYDGKIENDTSNIFLSRFNADDNQHDELYTAQKINLNSQFEFDLERELDLIDIRNA